VSEELGRTIGFLDWMLVGVPIAFSFILIAWFVMTRVLYRFRLHEVASGRDMIQEELRRLGRLTQGEKMVLLVFAGAAFLWLALAFAGRPLQIRQACSNV
jgi:sodium-dependent dicarboxylate transporter 2/3/5